MIIACYKIINEIQWLKCSIDSIYNFVDRIVIVEGCDSFMKQAIGERVTKEGLSVDGTTELIENYPDVDKKIKHIKLGFVEGDESDLWNAYLKECPVGSWCWSIDGDEIYPESQAQRIVDLMNSGEYSVIRINLHNLWKITNQRIVGGGWNTIHERAVKIIENGMFYRVLSDLKCFDGVDLSKKDTVFYDENLFLIHFSYVRDKQKMLEKMVWQLKMYEKWDTHPKWAHHKKMYKGDPAKYLQRNHIWFTSYFEEGINVVDYEISKDVEILLRNNGRL